jgi:hypothetical protein
MVFENNGKLRVSRHLTKINDSKSSYKHIFKKIATGYVARH